MSGKKHRAARRVDYWADPAAPKPTSRKPSASVIVRNGSGDVLLLHRPDSGRWTIPTGGLKKNETLTQCAVRECREETGLDIEPVALTGVYKNMTRGVIALVFRAKITGGDLAASNEATAFRWAAEDQIRELAAEAYAIRVLDALTDEPRTAIRAHDGTRLL